MTTQLQLINIIIIIIINLRSHLWLKLKFCKIKSIFKKKTIKNQINILHSNKQTQTPVKNATKLISVRCKNWNSSVAEFYYILSTTDYHTVCWKWEENQYKYKLCFRSTYWSSFKGFLVLLNVTLTYLKSELFVLWYLTETDVFWKYHVFPARITRKKTFQSIRGPTWGTIFRSRISVTLSKVLYMCPVLRNKLVLFIFYSDGTAVYLFLLFRALFSFSVVKSVLCGTFSADTVTSSNEELLLSEVSQ